MKKILIPVIGLLMLFTACEPNEDIYDTLDSRQGAYTDDIEISLTAEDYETFSDLANDEDIATYNSFNANSSIKHYMPTYLETNYPALKGDENNQSHALVTYNYSYAITLYEELVELSDSDYEAMELDTNFFSNNSIAINKLKSYLENIQEEPEENDFVVVDYDYFDDEDSTVVEAQEYFYFNGSEWGQDNDAYVLEAEDYDAMGDPGNYDNFSESESPIHYLPIWLESKYPYANSGDDKILVYTYFNGDSAQIHFNKFFYENNIWNYYEVNTDQFIYGTGGEWVFDPTITLTMGVSDYQLIADEDPNPNSYGTGGYYYGADAYYNDFDMRITKRREEMPDTYENLTDEEALELMWERLREGLIIFLQKKFPDAQPQVDGIDVFYIIKFDTFTENYYHEYFEIKYQCTAATSGSDAPQFEEVEGSLTEIDELD